METKTLKPPMPSLPPFPSSRRRSHLDSASYRTLVRILSHCLDHSLVPHPNPRPDAAPPQDPKGFSAEKCASLIPSGDGEPELPKDQACSNPRRDGILNGEPPAAPDARVEVSGHGDGDDGNQSGPLFTNTEPEQEHSGIHRVEVSPVAGEAGHGDGDDGNQNGPVFTNTEQEQEQSGIHSSVEQRVNAGSADSESPSDPVSDCPILIDVQDDVLRSVEEFLNADEGPVEQLHNFEDMTFGLLDDSNYDENQEPQDGHASITLPDNELCDSYEKSQREDSKEISTVKIARKYLIERSESGEEIMEGVQQEMHIRSDSAVDCSAEGIEEGEIPDDVQILEDEEKEQGSVYDGFSKEGHQDRISSISQIDNDGFTGSRENICDRDVLNLPIHYERDELGQMSHDEKCLEPQMKESYSNVINANFKCRDVISYASSLFEENEVNTPTQSVGEQCDAKGVDVKVRKKRGPLTEERKTKMKIAKKRKRAQKDREQGVKKLKLQPIVKPKVVKQCNFYMQGRCRQGDLCRFSHDAIPLTKSQPCKHFACGSCLKGDDCPFDHQLSKYPCHNYMSKGMCSRGDKCKFSHKISITEDSSIATFGKPHSPMSSEKRLNSNSTSLLVNGPKSTTSSTPFPLNKHLETDSVKCLKEPLRVPNGVRFLSFGNGSSDSASKQEKLLTEKHNGVKTCNQERFADRHKTALPSAHNTPLVAQSESKTIPNGAVRYPARSAIGNNKSKNSSFSSGPVVAPFSGSLQNEVSDATKILDEFLFGAGS